MPTPYHDTPVYTHSDYDTSLSSTVLVADTKLAALMDNIPPEGLTISTTELLGKGTLTDGGVYGKMMRLTRIHLEDMKNRNELTEEAAGEVYSNTLNNTMNASIDFLFKNNTLKLQSTDNGFDKIRKFHDINNVKLSFDASQVKRHIDVFNRDELLPLEREKIIEDIEIAHISHEGKTIENNTLTYNLGTTLPLDTIKRTKDHILQDDDHKTNTNNHILQSDEHAGKLITNDTSSYNLDTTLPLDSVKRTAENVLLSDEHVTKGKEQLLLDDEHTTKTKGHTLQDDDHTTKLKDHTLQDDEHAIKVFTVGTIMPKEATKLDNENNALVTELSIRDYYNTDIQPVEGILLEDKHVSNEKELSIRDYYKVNMQPIEKTLLSDEHDAKARELAIREYYNISMQPEELLTLIANRTIAQKEVEIAAEKLTLAQKEILLKQADIDLRAKELDIKTYELTTLIPAQVNKINAEIELMSANKCIATAECAIKNYYNTYIQPLEKSLTEGKANFERVNAGWDGTTFTIEESLARQRVLQMKKQTELYDRQKTSYDDVKWQKLFDTQVNYRSMIFGEQIPDGSGAVALVESCKDVPVTNTYTKLTTPTP